MDRLHARTPGGHGLRHAHHLRPGQPDWSWARASMSTAILGRPGGCSSFVLALTFAGGIGVILLGVRTVLAEIVPAFRGISTKIVPQAVPALDCPVVFPYAPNALLIGYLTSIVGGLVAMFIQIAGAASSAQSSCPP